jgi:putative tricarboxylic transport membrane protein
VTGEPAGARRNRPGAAVVSLCIVALGIFVLVEAITGADNPGYAAVGPGGFPGVVGFALIVTGFCLLLQAVRGQWDVVWFEHAPSDLLSPGVSAGTSAAPFINVVLVAAGLVLDVILMPPLGFIVASTVLFTLVATAFGRRRFIVDAAIGLVFAGIIFVAFVHGLGLHLPAGSLWEGLPWRS